MRIAAFIPARAGSTRLPGKNLARINGRTLVARAMHAGHAARAEVVLSTDDEHLLQKPHGVTFPVTLHQRPPALATAEARVTDAIMHWYAGLTEKPGIIVLLNPTSLFRTSAHVVEAIELLEEYEADSVVSVTRGHESHFGGLIAERAGAPRWFPTRGSEAQRARTQDLGGGAYENGAIFAFTRAFWERERAIMGGVCLAYPMTKWDSIDIDTQEDLDAARLLAGTTR